MNLQKICKVFGGITIQGKRWVWDYVSDTAKIESEMSIDQKKNSRQAKIIRERNEIESFKREIGGR